MDSYFFSLFYCSAMGLCLKGQLTRLTCIYKDITSENSLWVSLNSMWTKKDMYDLTREFNPSTHMHAPTQSGLFTPVVTVLSTVWLSLLQLLTLAWFASPWLPHSLEGLCVHACVCERQHGIREALQVYLVYLCSVLHH